MAARRKSASSNKSLSKTRKARKPHAAKGAAKLRQRATTVIAKVGRAAAATRDVADKVATVSQVLTEKPKRSTSKTSKPKTAKAAPRARSKS